MVYVLIFLLAWAATGVSLALLFRRLGHNFLVFATLGVALGPLVVLLIADSTRRADIVPEVIRRGRENPSGSIDVLIGLDGSDACLQSTVTAFEILRPIVRNLRLATVLDLETARAPKSFQTDEERIAHLHRAATVFDWGEPELVVLGGSADRALIDHGSNENVDLIVVSHRRHHLSALLLGSTVARLARRADLALMIGPAPAAMLPPNVTELSNGKERAHVH